MTDTAGTTGAGWRLDELGNAGRENLDAAHVARYDGKMEAGATAELLLLRRLGLTSGSTMIDFGAGTGQFTLDDRDAQTSCLP